MSTTIMAACWGLQMGPTQKAVLISLADNSNDHGECWPSISTICKRTCYGRTAVINAIKWLESQGTLRADRTNGRHTRYLLTPGRDLFERGEPVREANQYARRTGTANAPHQSVSRTGPVRQADSNRQEPSRTEEQERCAREAELPAPVVTPSPGGLACLALREAGIPAARLNPSLPKLLEALALGITPAELADVAREFADRGRAPPGMAYVIQTAINRRHEVADNPATASGPARPPPQKSKTLQAIETIDRVIYANSNRTARLDTPRIGQGPSEAALLAAGRPARG